MGYDMGYVNASDFTFFSKMLFNNKFNSGTQGFPLVLILTTLPLPPPPPLSSPVILVFVFISWKAGWTLAPPTDSVCKVLFGDYQPHPHRESFRFEPDVAIAGTPPTQDHEHGADEVVDLSAVKMVDVGGGTSTWLSGRRGKVRNHNGSEPSSPAFAHSPDGGSGGVRAGAGVAVGAPRASASAPRERTVDSNTRKGATRAGRGGSGGGKQAPRLPGNGNVRTSDDWSEAFLQMKS